MLFGIVLALAGVLALAHTAPFAFVLDAAAGRTSIWRVASPAGKKVIYLTFDDGPNPTATPQLLDLLDDQKVRATFFLIDKYVDADTAPIVRRMFEGGHTVAQHSGERWLMLRTPASLERRLREDADKIERLAGRRPCPLFRPHAGWRSAAMLRGLGRGGYKLVGWSWRMWDWNWFRKRTADAVARNVVAHAGPGKIVVIHDGHHTNPRADRRYAIEATRRIIEELRAQGYEFGTLCEAVP